MRLDVDKISLKQAVAIVLAVWISAMMPAFGYSFPPVNADVQQRVESRVNQPYEAQYVVTRRGREHGTAIRRLRELPDHSFSYFTVTDVSFLFLSDRREQITEFRFYDGQVQPSSYQYKRTGTGENESRDYQFQSGQEVMTNGAGEVLEVEWSETLLDANAVLHQLQFDLALGATEFSYPVIDEHGKRDVYTFLIEADETLTLPYGTIDTIRVKRIRETNRRETFIWFAPILNYSIVQMQQLKEGKEQAKLSLKTLTYPS